MKKESMLENASSLTNAIDACVKSAERIEKAILAGNDGLNLDPEKALHSAANAASTAVRAQVSAYQAASK